MSKQEHTPGPWRVHKEVGYYFVLTSKIGQPDIAKISYYHPDSIANTNLIASAPELLDALRYIESVALANDPRDLPSIAEKARAAIAKATTPNA